MKKTLIYTIKSLLIAQIILLSSFFSAISYAQFSGIQDDRNNNTGNFNTLLDNVTSDINSNLPNVIGLEKNVPEWGIYGMVDFVFDFMMDYVVPIVIIIATLIAIFWFYQLMFSEKEDQRSKATDYILRWVVWIIIIQWSRFIYNTFFSIVNNDNVFEAIRTWSLNALSADLFEKLIYPFLNLGMYMILWVLFIMLLMKSVQIITSQSDDAFKKWQQIIVSSAIGIIVILLSKQIIQVVYGKQEDFTKSINETQGIFSVWNRILNERNYETIFNVINYFLWFLAFIILCLLIYNTYLIITNPTKEENIKKLRTNILYILLWLLIIWLSYVIVNFLIIR